MNQTLDIPTLYANIYNMHAADEEKKDLVPSVDGKDLYIGGMVKWLWYDLYYAGLNGKQKKEAAREKAIALTRESFQQLMERELTPSEVYEYSTYLAPLVKKIMLPKLDHDDPIAMRHAQIKRRLTIMRFEDLSNRTIPYEGLESLPEYRKNRELEEWIAHINYRSLGKPWFWERWLGEGELITGGDVHKVIKILASRWSYDPDMMIYQLRELGCTFFSQPDSKFLQKRTRWIQSKTIRWKGRQFELGRNFSDVNQNETLIFNIKKSHQFVILSDNTTRLQLNAIDHRLLWDQVSKAPIHLMDPVVRGDGFQVFERFDFRMTTPPWRSKKVRWIYANTIVTFVAHMIWYCYTPEKVSVGSLGWIEERLFTVESLTMETIHIGKIAHYIWEWTKGSPKIYKYVMKKTGIADSIECEFFQQILIDMGRENKRSVWEMMRKGGFFPNAAMERSIRWIPEAGQKFQKEAAELAAIVGPEALLEAYKSHMAFGFVDCAWFYRC